MIEIYLLKLTSLLEMPVEKFLKYFTEKRREKILRYKFTADRNRTLWTELLVRSIIAKKISRPIEEVLIERDELGKPYVVNSKFKISLAHSENWAACSVGEVPSGIDVEENFADALAIAQNFFTPQEYQQLCNVDGWTRAEKFLSLWTIKESFVKFTGCGIDENFNSIDSTQILADNVGKNFFVDKAVIGVYTERDNLPKNFTIIPQNFFDEF